MVSNDRETPPFAKTQTAADLNFTATKRNAFHFTHGVAVHFTIAKAINSRTRSVHFTVTARAVISPLPRPNKRSSSQERQNTNR